MKGFQEVSEVKEEKTQSIEAKLDNKRRNESLTKKEHISTDLFEKKNCESVNADDTSEGKAEIAYKNKMDGCRREDSVEEELKKQYPESSGYKIIKEAYLRDKDGNIVKDPETGQARRIDFVVVKNGKVVDSVEVTSKTASKDAQSAKEERIRENGGNYIKDPSTGELVRMPDSVHTRIERRK